MDKYCFHGVPNVDDNVNVDDTNHVYFQSLDTVKDNMNKASKLQLIGVAAKDMATFIDNCTLHICTINALATLLMNGKARHGEWIKEQWENSFN